MKNEVELTNFDKNMLNMSLNWNDSGTADLPSEDMAVYTGTVNHYVDYPYFRQNWYGYCTHTTEDKTKQAFRIVKLLMKKKLVKVDKVKDFIELIDGILEIL